MILSSEEIDLFTNVRADLCWGMNQMHRFLPEFERPTLDCFIEIAMLYPLLNKIWKKPTLIDAFLSSPYSDFLPECEREIIIDWRTKFIRKDLFIYKQLKKHTVFIDIDKLLTYAVIGVGKPIAVVVKNAIPCFCEITLLPFRNKIIYDGTIKSTERLNIGPLSLIIPLLNIKKNIISHL